MIQIELASVYASVQARKHLESVTWYDKFAGYTAWFGNDPCADPPLNSETDLMIFE